MDESISGQKAVIVQGILRRHRSRLCGAKCERELKATFKGRNFQASPFCYEWDELLVNVTNDNERSKQVSKQRRSHLIVISLPNFSLYYQPNIQVAASWGESPALMDQNPFSLMQKKRSAKCTWAYGEGWNSVTLISWQPDKPILKDVGHFSS